MEGNPLEDVRHAREIAGVAVRGRWFEKSDMDDRRSALAERYEQVNEVTRQVDEALEEEGAAAAVGAILAAHGHDPEIGSAIESQLNSAGYGAAIADDIDGAAFILRLATKLFPDSANAWDSLAEITLYRGDRDAAIEYYRNALELDPEFSNVLDSWRSF